MNIGMTYDLRTEHLAQGLSVEQAAEFDSEETIAAIEQAIAELGHVPVRIGSGKSLCRRLAAGERWELVFNIAEGLHGRSREAQVPCLLELYDIAYTGSDPLVCAVTLDKAVAKKLVAQGGVRTPAYHLIRGPEDLNSDHLAFPLFVKPNAEGTGKGISPRSHVSSVSELRSLAAELLADYDSLLVEEFLCGREFTVGIVGTGCGARVIGTMELEVIEKQFNGIYSLETKELCESLVRYSALREPAMKKATEDLALRAYNALECRDFGRVDIRLDAAGQPHFLEVNPLPGLHPHHSDLPMIATQEGIPYTALIGSILESAMRRSAA